MEAGEIGDTIKINNLSFAELKLLINMSMIKILKTDIMTLSMLAEKIQTQQSSPNFVKVTNLLKEWHVLKVKPYFGNTKKVEIDVDKLTDIIDEQMITLFFYKYFKEWHVITW